jgi:lipopolysaccharide transport system permease protein
MATEKIYTSFSNKDDTLLQSMVKVWHSKSLIVTLAQRDIQVKYAQTLLGIAWTVVQPLTGLLIFTFFFGKLIHLQTGDLTYELYSFPGMLCWYFFSYIMYQSSTSILYSSDLIKKINFPKIIIPLSKVLVGLVDFLISFVLLIILMLIENQPIGIKILTAPLFVILLIVAGLSVALLVSALTFRYRDLQHIIPYLVNFGIWVTPVFYPVTLIPDAYKWLLYINPVAGIIDGLRWALYANYSFHWQYAMGIAADVLLFIIVLFVFVKAEQKMSDEI